ncbi:hypothetical protein BD413DRAFT_516671 [Trametes elegans]|nr:hypothetical protein BD413DRAFT_516671 [Trametes elegans]
MSLSCTRPAPSRHSRQSSQAGTGSPRRYTKTHGVYHVRQGRVGTRRTPSRHRGWRHARRSEEPRQAINFVVICTTLGRHL